MLATNAQKMASFVLEQEGSGLDLDSDIREKEKEICNDATTVVNVVDDADADNDGDGDGGDDVAGGDVGDDASAEEERDVSENVAFLREISKDIPLVFNPINGTVQEDPGETTDQPTQVQTEPVPTGAAETIGVQTATGDYPNQITEVAISEESGSTIQESTVKNQRKTRWASIVKMRQTQQPIKNKLSPFVKRTDGKPSKMSRRKVVSKPGRKNKKAKTEEKAGFKIAGRVDYSGELKQLYSNTDINQNQNQKRSNRKTEKRRKPSISSKHKAKSKKHHKSKKKSKNKRIRNISSAETQFSRHDESRRESSVNMVEMVTSHLQSSINVGKEKSLLSRISDNEIETLIESDVDGIGSTELDFKQNEEVGECCDSITKEQTMEYDEGKQGGEETTYDTDEEDGGYRKADDGILIEGGENGRGGKGEHHKHQHQQCLQQQQEVNGTVEISSKSKSSSLDLQDEVQIKNELKRILTSQAGKMAAADMSRDCTEPTDDKVPPNTISLKEARAAERRARALKRREMVEKKRREREEQIRREKEAAERQERIHQEMEVQRLLQEEEARLHRQQMEEERRRKEAEEEELERRRLQEAEAEKKRKEEHARKILQLKMKQMDEERRRQEMLVQQRQEEEEFRKAEQERLAAMAVQERQEYERKKAEEEERRILEEEAKRLRMEQEAKEIMQEAMQLAHDKARHLAELEERLRFTQTLHAESIGLMQGQTITRAFVFSYFELLKFLGKENADKREITERNIPTT
ncbi:trichohyalin [Octopus sinensis]|uniref:Trichohyalin n=1 Tax=Octopus sinensis TaxID=2607531 RepID=A0A6P7TUD9_9MOLL|nr:trichohyalin [Octopus sinensis]